MYKAIKHRSGARAKAIAAALICAAYLLCFATVGFAAPDKNLVHVEGTVQVDAIKAEFINTQSFDASKSSVSADGNKVTANISGLKYPGAGTVIRITSKNTGTLKATLVSIDKYVGDLDFIKIDMADVPIGDVLDPGEICVWDISVYWDPSYDTASVKESTDFQFVLTYENDEYVEEKPSGGDPSTPKTGDTNEFIIYAAIAVVSTLVLLYCLVFIIFDKRRKEDDESC